MMKKYLTLDEIHSAEVEILRWLNKICKEHNIALCLAGGTLLGAIRHKGFIPWDDDIDLMIPRDEYDDLIAILEKIDDERYSIVSMRDQNSLFAYAKIIDKFIYLEQEKNTREVTSNLWIDIFPVDGLPENENAMRKTFKKAKFFRMGLSVSNSHDLIAGNMIKRIIKPIVILPIKLFGSWRWLKKLDKLCRRIPFGATSNVGVICGGYGSKECMPYKDWIRYTSAEFEGDSYSVPGCWEYYLTSLYGNYMELPPEEKRHMHNVIAYRVKEDV